MWIMLTFMDIPMVYSCDVDGASICCLTKIILNSIVFIYFVFNSMVFNIF